MTPLVEALVLPALFLTVTLVGAIRPGAAVTLEPPSPASLVSAMMLCAGLVRSGALAPERLINGARSAIANLNGLVLLVTAFAASAQVLTLVVPRSGVPAFIGWAVLISLLLQAIVIGPDRPRLLRGLLVTFGVAFVLKFVVLAAMSTPAQGRVARAIQALADGVTLGAIVQPAPHRLDAYLAFGTLVLYLVGVAWLPSAAWHMVRREWRDQGERFLT